MATLKIRRGAHAGLALLILLAACSRLDAQQEPALDTEFQVPAGRTARIAGHDLRIRFDRVAQDSRCPADVQCVTAGDATVAISIVSGRAAPRRCTLHTDTGPRDVLHGVYRITLVALDPTPVSSRPTRPGDYVLTLRVDRPTPR